MSEGQAQKVQSHSAEPVCDNDGCDERVVTTCLTCRTLHCMFHARQHKAVEESHRLHDLANPQRNQQRGPAAQDLQKQPHRGEKAVSVKKAQLEAQSKTSDWQDHSNLPGYYSATTDSGISESSSEYGSPCDVCPRGRAVIKCITCDDRFCQSCSKHHTNMVGHQLQNLTQGSDYNTTIQQGLSIKQIQFTSVRSDTVSLSWPPTKDTSGRHRFKVTWTRGQEQRNLVVTRPGMEVTDLLPGEKYIFNVATISEDGDQKPYATGCIDTAVPSPENLAVEAGVSSASLTWTKPDGVGQVSYLLDIFRDGTHLNAIHRDSLHYTIPDLQHGKDYTVSVATVLSNGNQSNTISRTFKIVHDLAEVLSILGLKDLQGGKLTLSSVLEINRNTVSEKSAQSLEQLPWTFLRKLMIANINPRHNIFGEDPIYVEVYNTDHIYCDPKSIFETINPLDLITALFHCADPFLRQKMVSKMSICQFAVPLLLPNCDTQQSTLMLWAMRDIVKKFRPYSPAGDRAFVEGRVVDMDIPMVSFVRLGESSLAKSQTLNKLLSYLHQPNDTFVHHDMEYGDVPRRISDGLVEVSWYLPCGNTNIDLFREPVAMANLRGDGKLFKTQMYFLSQTSAAIFIFSDDLEGDFTALTNTDSKAELFLVTSSQSAKDICRKLNIKETNVVIKNRQNDEELVKTLRLYVSGVTEKKRMKILNMTASARQAGIHVDEDCRDCVKGRDYAEAISSTVKDIAQFKEDQLPLHGQMWQEISQTKEEMYSMKHVDRGQNIKQYRLSLQSKIYHFRKKQYQTDISEAMTNFTAGISQSKAVRLYFLKWLKIKLEHVCHQNPEQRNEYGHRTPQDKETTAGLCYQIPKCSLGPEHFFRELGQLYECACSLPDNTQARQQVQHLPPLCAQVLLDGYAVELVDGDASNIPMKWISEVLTQLHKLVTTKSRIQVLTVLGVQGSGKSTLLNTLFGVHFDISSGRCTRGAFMQLIRVSDEVRFEFKCDFIMIINTEGLKSPASLDTSYKHDNELATLVIGLSDITLINVSMENNTETKDILQIVVHAFLRMKEVLKKPKCLFVHQNVTDMSFHDNNMRDRKKLEEELNDMTRTAAKIENKDCNIKFSDVMDFVPDKDSYYIPGFWHGPPPMGPVNARYSKAVFELKKSLIGSLQTSSDFERNDARTFTKCTEDLLNVVKFENFIFNFKNSSALETYTTLYTEYENWEWSFRSAMEKWYADIEYNMPKGRPLSKSQVTEILQEAATALDKEEANINKHLDEYFAKNDYRALGAEHKDEFKSNITFLRREIERSIEYSLKGRNMISEGKDMNKIQNQTIRRKVKELQKICREKMIVLSDDGLDTEFESTWEDILGEIYPDVLPAQDVCQRVLSVLLSHFKTKSGQTKKLLSETNLQNCGLDKFTVKKQWLGRNQNPQKLQSICDGVIKECESYVSGKVQSSKNYSDAYIRELLGMIDKMNDLSEECEVSLKLNVCGQAVREFERVQNRDVSDPRNLEKLQRSKFNLLSVFKKEFRKGDSSV
ncbi:up-regulator of cell proliferation-like isoform X2 [Alosa alosa]|uniref:up-regulator of cell proliferation-like isoform X2 n=1 Tax=Alosa alosa TaxID=278164 RepID=UPI0020152628|nr:up-regulator of cell proliferation-like isoform X2 [Alosa alosa]